MIARNGILNNQGSFGNQYNNIDEQLFSDYERPRDHEGFKVNKKGGINSKNNSEGGTKKASETDIGTVRVATAEEFNNGINTGNNGEYLMPTIGQIKSNQSILNIHYTPLSLASASVSSKGASASVTYNVPRAGFVQYLWNEQVNNGIPVNVMRVDYSETTCVVVDSIPRYRKWSSASSINFRDYRDGYLAVGPGKLTLEMYINTDSGITDILSANVMIKGFFYFG